MKSTLHCHQCVHDHAMTCTMTCTPSSTGGTWCVHLPLLHAHLTTCSCVCPSLQAPVAHTQPGTMTSCMMIHNDLCDHPLLLLSHDVHSTYSFHVSAKQMQMSIPIF